MTVDRRVILLTGLSGAGKTTATKSLEDIGFPIVEKYDGIKDIGSLAAMNKDNKEGFVIKYSNNFRVKIKFEEYLRLHRIITQVSNLNIWEYLKTNQPIEEVLERVPDEFFNWVKKTKSDLENQYAVIENQCKADFKVLDSRKETALYFLTCQYSGVLFAMLDNMDYSEIIWRMIRPTFEKPFNREEE